MVGTCFAHLSAGGSEWKAWRNSHKFPDTAFDLPYSPGMGFASSTMLVHLLHCCWLFFFLPLMSKFPIPPFLTPFLLLLFCHLLCPFWLLCIICSIILSSPSASIYTQTLFSVNTVCVLCCKVLVVNYFTPVYSVLAYWPLREYSFLLPPGIVSLVIA